MQQLIGSFRDTEQRGVAATREGIASRRVMETTSSVIQQPFAKIIIFVGRAGKLSN